VVARRQLIAAGLTPAMLRSRLGNGRLLPLYPGVYAVGHTRLRTEGHWLAAVLAAGRGALLSHRDAAALHGLRGAGGTRIDVTTTVDRGDLGRIRIHRTRTLIDDDRTLVSAIPVTSVARTLVDLASVAPADRLRRALNEAERQLVLDVRAIEAVLARTRGRRGRGHAAIREALARQGALGTYVTRSELEERFVTLVDAAGLPRPRLNAFIEGVEVDAYWPSAALVVELDGFAYHRTAIQLQRDHDKDNLLRARGYDVRRFTHRDVTRTPERVAAQLRPLLARASERSDCR
jgi:very-short-patch-repair endonuclease